MSVFIRRVWGEEAGNKFESFAADVLKHRDIVFMDLLFPEDVQQGNKSVVESEQRKLGNFFKWCLPIDDFFLRAQQKKELRLQLSNWVLEEHEKMKPAPVSEVGPSTSTFAVEMITIPKEEFEEMKATNQMSLNWRMH